MLRHLTKPVRQADLLRAIRLACGGAASGALITRHTLQEGVPAIGERALRVLLAEDNAVNQQLARRVLEKRGHHVTVAVNGQKAVAEWEREAFDIILMDVQMPEMSGLAATAAMPARARAADGGSRSSR
jgi:two-component system sensor histidine kinase/response regulator